MSGLILSCTRVGLNPLLAHIPVQVNFVEMKICYVRFVWL